MSPIQIAYRKSSVFVLLKPYVSAQRRLILEQHLAVLGQWPKIVLDKAFKFISDLSYRQHRRNDEIAECLALMM